MSDRSRPKRARGEWKHVDGGHAFVIPVTLIRHENWKRLTPHCCKLMFDLGRQYSGFNNGYLCAAWDLMRREGWKSRETLYWAIGEAEHYGLIQRTRQGGRHRPNLYALTWWPVHGKDDNPLDTAPSAAPTNAWKELRPTFERERLRRNELHAQRAA